ncbi:MAG: T9SS type A sorting domain-containing protein [Clostridia bacterium]|nr:T9SS type A sorting domain-containing protein [Clostridia bacterium]
MEQFTEELEIEVYPNPASDVLYLNLPENTKDVRVEIYDNLGRQIITNELLGWENSIDVKQLKAGNYFVRIVSDNRNWRGWFVKE